MGKQIKSKKIDCFANEPEKGESGQGCKPLHMLFCASECSSGKFVELHNRMCAAASTRFERKEKL